MRAPLNAIAGSVLQLRSPSEAAREQAMSIIERNVTAEARLIDDVQLAADLCGRHSIALKPVNLVTLIRTAVRGAGSTTTVASIPDRPPTIEADASCLGQALEHLIRRMSGAAPQSRVISVTVEDDPRPGLMFTGSSLGEVALVQALAAPRRGRKAPTALGAVLVCEILTAHGARVALERRDNQPHVLSLVFPPTRTRNSHQRRVRELL
jgi:light-regulated signal transduction histidine kinase (bacteriophytochrome)